MSKSCFKIEVSETSVPLFWYAICIGRFAAGRGNSTVRGPEAIPNTVEQLAKNFGFIYVPESNIAYHPRTHFTDGVLTVYINGKGQVYAVRLGSKKLRRIEARLDDLHFYVSGTMDQYIRALKHFAETVLPEASAPTLDTAILNPRIRFSDGREEIFFRKGRVVKQTTPVGLPCAKGKVVCIDGDTKTEFTGSLSDARHQMEGYLAQLLARRNVAIAQVKAKGKTL